MHIQLTSAQLQADLVVGFDADELNSDSIACWRPQSSLDRRKQQDFIGPKVLSLSIKHVVAVWDMWQKGLDAALVFEDDAELVPTFNDDIKEVLQEAPLNWDMIMVGSCSGIHASEESLRVSRHLFRPTHSDTPTRCAHAILWSYSGAKKLLSTMPIRWTMDFHINSIAAEVNLQSYWMEPSLSEQTRKFLSILEPERVEVSQVTNLYKIP